MVEMSVQTKSYMVLGIVLGCFGILYPKLFHPMLMSSLGYYKQPSINDESSLHPRERMMRGSPSAKPQQASHGQHSPYAYGRPNPGMRMGGEGGQGGRVAGSGRGGVMTMILPLYAIGIVLYLLYTLVKVFGGNKKSGAAGRASAEDTRRVVNSDQSFRSRLRDFELNGEGDAATRRSAGSLYENLQSNGGAPQVDGMQKDLEQLLRKVEDRSMSDTEMRDLRCRLEDTEAQMTRILQQMQTVQRHVGAAAHVPAPAPDKPVSDSENDEFGDASSDLGAVSAGLKQRSGFVAADLH